MVNIFQRIMHFLNRIKKVFYRSCKNIHFFCIKIPLMLKASMCFLMQELPKLILKIEIISLFFTDMSVWKNNFLNIYIWFRFNYSDCFKKWNKNIGLLSWLFFLSFRIKKKNGDVKSLHPLLIRNDKKRSPRNIM